MEANDPGRAISIKYGKPLPRRPSYIRESDYWLIEALCKPTATKRASVANVLRSLYWLVTEEAIILRPLTSVKETVAGVDAVNCAPFETHMAGVLRQCLQLVGKSNTPAALSRRELNMHLYTRCWALHGLLVRHGTLPKKPVEKLGRRIVEFFTVLQSSAEPNTGDIYDFVAYHAQMQVYVDLHRGLDDCLADFGPVIQRPGEPEPPTVYQWQSRWSQLHQKQRELLLGGMKKASQALESELRNPRGVQGVAGLDLAETLAILQFELMRRRHRYAVEEQDLMTSVASNLLKVIRLSGLETWPMLPEWFVPTYELNCVPALCTAEPGQELNGKWRGRAVTDRIAHASETPDDIAETIETFYQLKHPNVYKCFGGCYGGTHSRYVVWDRPGSSLDKLTHGKKPSVATWTQLLDVSLGIQYLHSANVGVCDLTASAVNITADGRAQVTIKDSLTPRWTAPELLNGEAPTVASDVYAFGMVVLEALSGEVPWGPSVLDELVVEQVMQGKLPPRPANVRKGDWTLIRRLCCAEPADRVGLSVAIAAVMHAQRESVEAS
jgi:serine/threonine protein kinase